jgi:hypothetical protein
MASPLYKIKKNLTKKKHTHTHTCNYSHLLFKEKASNKKETLGEDGIPHTSIFQGTIL